ncbi:glycosyltransferase family 2 protein [Ciceribacter thiooxidans]|uniref:Glycosyltransferase family 2 protein n=1 Tax=Ciceribacter thiooxidans TaxID=1969821 RepID=A0ABV7I2F3_9HYPH|nr:glycosyltransferase family 2 protein [Ciceribacter thiooxidans]
MKNLQKTIKKLLKPAATEVFSPAVRAAFDGDVYLNANPDVARAGVDPLQHYYTYGVHEGRRPPTGFASAIIALAHKGDQSAARMRRAQIAPMPSRSLQELVIDEAKTDDTLGVHFPLPDGATIVCGVVLYNNEEDEIERLLRSIRRSVGVDQVSFVIAVINNGEQLTSAMHDVLRDYGAVPLENKDGNIGSSAGHTRLMQYAFVSLGAVAYMTLNPDGFFHPRALERMTRMAHRHAWGAAIEAAQLPNENGKYVNPDTLDTEWAVTACALFPRRIWEKVGGFNPHIFLYCDDVDYGWEIRRKGFMVKYCARAYYFHDYASRTAVSEFFQRNRLEAGRYLGHRWRNSEFRQFCEMRLLEMGFYTSVEEMPAIDHLPIIKGSVDAANFGNEFFFAQRRW